jgi:dTDP-4-dehydrorhamnose reductase
MKKVLVIGATGMLGNMVHRHLKSLGKYELYNTVYRNKLTDDSIVLDVTNKDELLSTLTNLKIDVVINCVGALVQESKSSPANAIYLNALFPHILKNWCDANCAKLIHMSTDCVFNGKKGDYSEDDFRDADDVYGRSKALGEIFDTPHCTLRTSIIGPELKKNGIGLFHWFMKQKKVVKGYTNAYWSGVTTLELAKAIHKTIQNDLCGLYHVTNGDKISKYDLLQLFKNQTTNSLITIERFEDYYSDKSLLKSSRYDFEVPPFTKMIQDMFDVINSNPLVYRDYVKK